MKEALVIFIILLLLLTIISVFGGSIRYSPDILTKPARAPHQPQFSPMFPPYEGFYGNTPPKHPPPHAKPHAPTAGTPSASKPPGSVHPPVHMSGPSHASVAPSTHPSRASFEGTGEVESAGASIEPFQGAGEFAPF